MELYLVYQLNVSERVEYLQAPQVAECLHQLFPVTEEVGAGGDGPETQVHVVLLLGLGNYVLHERVEPVPALPQGHPQGLGGRRTGVAVAGGDRHCGSGWEDEGGWEDERQGEEEHGATSQLQHLLSSQHGLIHLSLLDRSCSETTWTILVAFSPLYTDEQQIEIADFPADTRSLIDIYGFID